MASVKQETIKFSRTTRSGTNNVIEVLITKPWGKPEVVTSILGEKTFIYLGLKAQNYSEGVYTWESYAKASAKLRFKGWVKVEEEM